MPHVISYAVIRQSMRWMALPQPVALFGEAPLEFPDTYQQFVNIQFLGIDVRRRYGYPSLYDGSAAYVKFLDDIRESFCSDILPVEAHYEVATDMMTVKLSCTLRKRVEQVPLL